MTQISKRYLNKKIEERILDQFWTSLSSLSTKQKVALFLNDLLTRTEKIMLSKRLAVAFMLMKGHDYPTINDRLKVSDAKYLFDNANSPKEFWENDTNHSDVSKTREFQKIILNFLGKHV